MERTRLDNPISHRLDPRSSVEAAREVTESGRRDRHAAIVLDAVRAHPDSTAIELVEALSGALDEYQVRRRLTDLKEAGRVARGESRKCRVKGTTMVVWREALTMTTAQIRSAADVGKGEQATLW